MTRREYTDRVLSGLRRLTGPEREAVRAELDAHMEDHICGLLDLGYDEALAEERTMQRMGDPAEVSRELNKQYPLRWLILKWAAMALTAVLVLMLLTQVEWGVVKENLMTRFWPSQWYTYEKVYEFLDGDDTDIRVEIGTTTVRVCAARVTEIQPGTNWAELFPEERYLAVVVTRPYRTSLLELGRSPENRFLTVSGQQDNWTAAGYRAWYYLLPVGLGETAVMASYQEHGYDVSFSIPLNWGALP